MLNKIVASKPDAGMFGPASQLTNWERKWIDDFVADSPQMPDDFLSRSSSENDFLHNFNGLLTVAAAPDSNPRRDVSNAVRRPPQFLEVASNNPESAISRTTSQSALLAVTTSIGKEGLRRVRSSSELGTTQVAAMDAPVNGLVGLGNNEVDVYGISKYVSWQEAFGKITIHLKNLDKPDAPIAKIVGYLAKIGRDLPQEIRIVHGSGYLTTKQVYALISGESADAAAKNLALLLRYEDVIGSDDSYEEAKSAMGRFATDHHVMPQELFRKVEIALGHLGYPDDFFKHRPDLLRLYVNSCLTYFGFVGHESPPFKYCTQYFRDASKNRVDGAWESMTPNERAYSVVQTLRGNVLFKGVLPHRVLSIVGQIGSQLRHNDIVVCALDNPENPGSPTRLKLAQNILQMWAESVGFDIRPFLGELRGTMADGVAEANLVLPTYCDDVPVGCKFELVQEGGQMAEAVLSLSPEKRAEFQRGDSRSDLLPDPHITVKGSGANRVVAEIIHLSSTDLRTNFRAFLSQRYPDMASVEWGSFRLGEDILNLTTRQALVLLGTKVTFSVTEPYAEFAWMTADRRTAPLLTRVPSFEMHRARISPDGESLPVSVAVPERAQRTRPMAALEPDNLTAVPVAMANFIAAPPPRRPVAGVASTDSGNVTAAGNVTDFGNATTMRSPLTTRRLRHADGNRTNALRAPQPANMNPTTDDA